MQGGLFEMKAEILTGVGKIPKTKTPVEIFSTCPQSNGAAPEDFRDNVAQVARWCERYGCKGMLIYTDNSMVDPWLLAQVVIENTTSLCPLVAVQPIYMHPYSVAKMAASFGFLYHRQLYLNMVAGGFTNDLKALNDLTPHDRRYDRLVEYVTIIKRLLESSGPVALDGEFYKVDKLRMTPFLPPEIFPGVFVSGSSDAGLEAARTIGATAIMYPKPAGEYESEPPDQTIESGIRVGIIVRARSVGCCAPPFSPRSQGRDHPRVGDESVRFCLAQTNIRLGSAFRRQSILAGPFSKLQDDVPVLGRQLSDGRRRIGTVCRPGFPHFYLGHSSQ